jgi:hypothetical protein
LLITPFLIQGVIGDFGKISQYPRAPLRVNV